MITTKSFRKGSVVFREGDTENCMYEILEGKVGVYTDYGTKDERCLTTLAAGRMFGEMGVVEGKPRSATIVVLEAVTLRVVTEDDLAQYFAERPQKILGLMQATSARLRGLSVQYVDACRTVRDYVDAEDKGGASPELLERMKKYAVDSKKKKR